MRYILFMSETHFNVYSFIKVILIVILNEKIMSNFTEIPPVVENTTRQHSFEDGASNFRRRILSTRRCVCPRRYFMALLLSIILAIEVSRHWNSAFTSMYVILADGSEAGHPTVGNWTLTELDNLGRFLLVGEIFGNILGGLLIYQFSSHKFLLVTVTISSFLHTLTTTALNHHSLTFLLIVMIGQEMLSVPIFTAVLSMWKDWAPPEERTRLVTISLCGIGLEAVSLIVFFIISTTVEETVSYNVGIAGIIWALFWYNTTSSTPQNDPLITEKELLYLESKIPSNSQETIKLADVPWKAMVKSKQVWILCLLFLKLACSVDSMQINAMIYIFYQPDIHNPLVLFIPFIVIFIFVLLGSSFLMDFLLNKYKDKTLVIRKGFLCTGFVLQTAFLFGAIIIHSDYLRIIFYIIAYCIFAFSIPGILRYPLDLSPRYVPIIAGFGFGFFSLGTLILHGFTDFGLGSMRPDRALFICDGIITWSAAAIFGKWGDVEEQSWSFLNTSQRRGNDYMSYPQPDDEDDINLVT